MQLKLSFESNRVTDDDIKKLRHIQSLHPHSGLSTITIVITTQDHEIIVINSGAACVTKSSQEGYPDAIKILDQIECMDLEIELLGHTGIEVI